MLVEKKIGVQEMHSKEIHFLIYKSFQHFFIQKKDPMMFFIINERRQDTEEKTSILKKRVLAFSTKCERSVIYQENAYSL